MLLNLELTYQLKTYTHYTEVQKNLETIYFCGRPIINIIIIVNFLSVYHGLSRLCPFSGTCHAFRFWRLLQSLQILPHLPLSVSGEALTCAK